ncbi:histidine utilization repressor [Shinella daejeonensis]|uniref:histidine utilization repressor n=1 Tax=Shinella daejeonensis TaxID=659017 RepID=UPI0020C80795|nr:histidine utilization repressor [Shinella daejeonensis]
MTSKTSARSTLHQKILGDIEKNIVSGEWPPGFRLPFEVELAKSYNVSRMTVNKVLTRLASAGLIERRKKSGSFVAQPQVQSAILEIHDIEAEVRSLKRDYRFVVLAQSVRTSTAEDLASFGLSKKANILEIACVHHAGDTPFCYEYRLVNLDVVPTAAEADFHAMAPGQWLRMQVPWSTAEHKIYAVAADRELADHLDVVEQAPCLVVQRRTWDDQGAVTFARFTYPAEKHAIVARFTPASSA